jgi:hypothetical protein
MLKKYKITTEVLKCGSMLVFRSEVYHPTPTPHF